MSKTLTLSLDNLIKILEKKCLDEDGIMHFDPEHLDMLQEETEYLGERLGLSPLQCVFLARVIQTQEKSCSIRKIFPFFKFISVISFCPKIFCFSFIYNTIKTTIIIT